MSPEKLTSAEQIAAVPRGERAHFVLPVARLATGQDLLIHVHVLKGVEDGPSLGLVANIHGDASYGAWTVMNALTRLKASDLRGTVIGVPVANPVAFESATRTTGQGWNTDMNNMNRVFPGDKGGWISQQMAWAISQNVIPAVDAIIDYHCGDYTSIDYTLVNCDETPEQKRVYNYTRLMATEHIFIHDKDPFAGTIDQYAKSQGKLSIVAEQGGNILPKGYQELAQTRVDNFLKGLGMIDGEPILPEKQLVCRPPRVLPRIEAGGIFVPATDVSEVLAQTVDGGTLLGTVYDPHGNEVLQELRAPYEKSAIYMARTAFGRVNPGDYAYIIGDATRGEWIPRMTDWKVQL